MCKETWGIFPCSDSVLGSIVLMIVYGYLLLRGAQLLSNGSELLLEVISPGIIGGLLLPILGALPDALIIVVSGLGGTKKEAAEQVNVGIGTLAGSTIMLLTVAWGGSLIAGRCDLDDKGQAINKKLTHKWSLFKTGVTTDNFTPKGSAIMTASVLLYAIIQIPAFAGTSDHISTLAGCIVCLVCLAAYCVFQVAYPELQKRKMERARHRQWRHEAVRAMQRHAQPMGSMLTEQGDVNDDVLEQLFKNFDTDNSGTIDKEELKGLLLGISLSSNDSNSLQETAQYYMKTFDTDKSGSITYPEFRKALTSWIGEKRKRHEEEQRKKRKEATSKGLKKPSDDGQAPQQQGSAGPQTNITVDPLLSEVPESANSEEEEEEDAEDEAEDEKKDKEAMSTKKLVTKSVLMLLAGTIVCAVISDPMVDAVSNFSKASKIPAFYVAFVVTPYASNASELVSSLIFAMRKHKKNISLTFSQVYGAVTMNNTLCLGLFLLVMHIRDLPWRYSSEVITTVIATFLVGALGYFKYTFATFWAIPVLLIYPLSILMVWGLDRAGLK
ncbi:g5620 [Coccomyxa viridis]|uniref:G5620 protein n=1 Tax=Coccomyxa viridis TaxID=1274662 RepID=A0ABP1FZY4_9CHLO